MKKIVIIMGKSSSGKDTIYKKLIERTNLKTIVPYTTRPQRTGEINGKDYYFVTDKYLEENKQNIIESRTYDTVHGKWTYCEMMDHQLSETSDDNYILITTLEGYNGFLEYFGKEKLVPVYIYVDNGIRLQRALEREKSQAFPKYTELCRRFLADEEDFADEKLLSAGVTNQFENNNLEEVLSEIIDMLKSEDIDV
jgi:guanylate kinase